MGRIAARGIGLLSVVFLFCAIGSPLFGQTKNYDLKWGTTVAGGAWQILGSAMIEDIKKANPNIAGSAVPAPLTAALMNLGQGKFNIAFTLTDSTADAWEGQGYFKGKPIKNLRNLVTLYPHATHIVVRADSNIKKIEDLRGKRICPSARGTSCDVETQRILKLYGMTYNDVKVQFVSFEDAAVQFIDGHLDALMFITSPYPFAPVINVNSHRQVRLISIPDDKVAEMTKFRGVEAHAIPAGIYKGIDTPTKGIAVRSHIAAVAEMPDDIAYGIVKAIHQNYGKYPSILKPMQYARPEDMAKDTGIPLHPGAAKFYKERGLIK